MGLVGRVDYLKSRAEARYKTPNMVEFASWIA